jgi:predicted RNA-binding Zn-ribbon protein involved in translation (DUF1610 family)
MDKEIITVCPFCGEKNIIKVNSEDFDKWQNGGLIQDCFPYLSSDERELLMTGICPKCWFDTFNDLDD